MARPSSVLASLNYETRQQLKRRIRASNYISVDSHHQWVKERCPGLSRSAVGRYMRSLKEQDDARLWDPEAAAYMPSNTAELWQELADIRARESEILEILRAVDSSRNSETEGDS